MIVCKHKNEKIPVELTGNWYIETTKWLPDYDETSYHAVFKVYPDNTLFLEVSYEEESREKVRDCYVTSFALYKTRKRTITKFVSEYDLIEVNECSSRVKV